MPQPTSAFVSVGTRTPRRSLFEHCLAAMAVAIILVLSKGLGNNHDKIVVAIAALWLFGYVLRTVLREHSD